MTATVVPQDDPDPQQRSRWGTGRVTLGVLLVVAGFGGSWWWSHPALFLEQGNGVGGSTQAGVPFYIGMADVPAHESIHLIDARPRVVSRHGPVEVQVLVCRRPNAREGVGALSDVTGVCEHLRSPGGRVQGDDQLLLEVFADGEGAVVVEGIDVTYRTPYQRGTQTTGPTVRMEVSP